MWAPQLAGAQYIFYGAMDTASAILYGVCGTSGGRKRGFSGLRMADDNPKKTTAIVRWFVTFQFVCYAAFGIQYTASIIIRERLK